MADKRRYDDNPEWTAEDFARARPASEVHGPEIAAAMIRKPGRPRLDKAERKVPVSIRLSPDVLDALRASGDGWQTRADEILRKALGLGENSLAPQSDRLVTEITHGSGTMTMTVQSGPMTKLSERDGRFVTVPKRRRSAKPSKAKA